MLNEFTRALRTVRRTPATAAIAVGTLALGVAVSISIFSIIRGVVLRGLPYPDADQLSLVWQSDATDITRRGPMSPPDIVDIREQSTTLDHVVGVNSFTTTYLPDAGDPSQVQLGVVAGDFFGAMRVAPMLGRALTLADDRPLNTRDSTVIGLIVLAHDFWTTQFASDSSVVGRTIRMGGSRMQVVGVMPAGFRMHLPRGAPMSTDFVGWTPLGVNYASAPREGAYLTVLGRMKPGTTTAQAQAEIDGIAARLRAQFPAREGNGYRLRVESLEQEVTAHIRPVLLTLGISGIVVLLVAAANVGTLLLVRFTSRRQEVAIRTALGSARGRIVRSLLTESGLIAVAGTVLGVALASPAMRLVLQLEPGIVPRTGELGIGPDMLVPALVLAVLLTILCGVGPAFLVTKGDLVTALRAQRAGGALGSIRVRRTVVVAQTAVTLALVYSSVSLVGTLMRLQRADVGFRAEGALTFVVTLPFAMYRDTESWVRYFEEAPARLRASPGISGAAAVSGLPMSGVEGIEPIAFASERDVTQWGTRSALHQVVTPGYFATAGIALQQGRDFSPVDRPGGVNTAIVDETLARSLSAAEPGPVIGRRIDVTVHEFRPGYRVTRRPVEIIGVVGTVAHDHPDATPPGTVYMAHAQYPVWAMNLVVTGANGVTPGAGAVRAVLRDIDSRLPLHAVQPMANVASRVLAPTRFVLVLIGIFAVTVVALTAAGLFGIMSDDVRHRRGELAIRLALGAEPRRIALRVLRGGLALAVVGIVPGIALAPLAERAIASSLNGGAQVSIIAIIAAVGVVIAIAAMACYLPAWRASRVDPVTALR